MNEFKIVYNHSTDSSITYYNGKELGYYNYDEQDAGARELLESVIENLAKSMPNATYEYLEE